MWPSKSDPKIEIAGGERVNEVREPWLALHHHHRSVATLQPLVADDEASWRGRRALYAESLAMDRGFLAIALAGEDDGRVGYAMVRFGQGPDDTWPVGELYAELYSLSVAPDDRGRGIGGTLFDAVESFPGAGSPTWSWP